MRQRTPLRNSSVQISKDKREEGIPRPTSIKMGKTIELRRTIDRRLL